MLEQEALQKVVSAVRDHGLSPCTAISRAMGFGRTRDYAKEVGFRRAEVCMCLNGKPSRLYPDIRQDVAQRLGLTLDELNALIVELHGLWGGR